MKKFLLLGIIFAATAFCAHAQTNDYSTYLDKARGKIEAGDCEGAQKFYNVYKELSGQTSWSLEKSISDCNKQKNSKKTYSIGDDAKDFLGLDGYKIAYLDASGKHGFAIKYYKLDCLPGSDSFGPSIEELRLIYSNRYSLGLQGEFWSTTLAKESGGILYYREAKYYTIDFSTGEENKRSAITKKKYHRLWIKRF